MAWVPVINLKGPTGYTGYTGIKGPTGSGVDIGDGYIGPTGYTGPTGDTGDRDFLTFFSTSEFDGINNIPQTARLGDYLIDLTTGIMWLEGTYNAKYNINLTDSGNLGYIGNNPHEVNGLITPAMINTKVSQVAYTFTLDSDIINQELVFIPTATTDSGLYGQLIIDGINISSNNIVIIGERLALKTGSISLLAGTHTIKFSFNYQIPVYPQLSLGFAPIYTVTTPIPGGGGPYNNNFFHKLDTTHLPFASSFGREVTYKITVIDDPLYIDRITFVPSQYNSTSIDPYYAGVKIDDEWIVSTTTTYKSDLNFQSEPTVNSIWQIRTRTPPLQPGEHTLQFVFNSVQEFTDKFVFSLQLY